MTRIEQTPDADDRCPWWNGGDRLGAVLRERVEVDCVVVGAGYSGLAVARRLAALREDWSIALVEALRVGQGSAGRNSGFVVDVGHWRPELGADGNAAFVRLARHGIELLRAADVDCEWSECGRYHVAVNKRGLAALETFRGGLDAMGEAYTRADPAVLGTNYYAQALHLPGGALVQPARLVRGLAANLPENVRLFEESPVRCVRAGLVETSEGSLAADRVVLCTNGFARAFGQRRVVPLLTFASVTAPQPDAGEPWGAVPEELMGSTLRRTPDGRILVRNGVRYHPACRLDGVDHDAMRRMHRESFEARFPDLRDVPFTHTWTGLLGMTLNGGTAFGTFGDDAWICAAYNGVGIALGTALGDLLARRIAGESHPLLEAAATLPAPGWLPPGPLQALGLPAYTAVLQKLAGTER